MPGNRNAKFTLLVLALAATVTAQPASLPFVQCTDSGSAVPIDKRINVSTVYAQIASYNGGDPMLKYTIIGDSGDDIYGASAGLLSTLFETSTILSFNLDPNANDTTWAFCQNLRAPSSVVPFPNIDNCTIPSGPVAFSASVPYKHDYSLTTINTRLRAVNGYASELVCVDVSATPVDPHGTGGFYGRAQAIFWVSVGLAIGYWVVSGIGRIAAAWDRGGSGRRQGWLRFKWAGTVLSSAISGERLSASPALLRFATPSMRDIIFHTQWCAGLAMVAVQWPGFTYPILRNAAWATLVYNVTLIQGSNADNEHWDATRVRDYTPPPEFADQIANATSPLFLDANIDNRFFLLPEGIKPGLRSFAYAVGIRPQDLFGTCLAIYLSIVAATVVISSIIWFGDWLISSAFSGSSGAVRMQARSPRYSAQSEGALSKDGPESPRIMDDVSMPPPPTSRVALQSRKAWWNYRLGQSSFHRNILYGNLVRILLLFHVPITLYSVFQFTIGRPEATVASLALAGVAFTFLSLLLPALLLYRISVTSSTKLYEATRTLLSLGPLYYHYAPGQQYFAFMVFAHNLAFSLVVGAGQKSGTAQSIILLVLEVMAALGTSMWLPWGEGANMGAVSFMFCVGRIITCVLLVILSPVVNVGNSAAGWIAYAIFIINGLIYLTFALMLLTKVIEGIVRLSGKLPFDHSRNSMDSGLFGAIGMLPCCGRRKRRKSRRHRYRPAQTQSYQDRRQSSGTSQMLGTNTSKGSGGLPGGLPYQMGHVGTSTSVPSYLRPEQASTPYREEGDDPESGYILGAFHDDYVPPQAQQNLAPPSNTGFTRVKGGRAHFDNPFAIQAGPPQNEQRPRRSFQGAPIAPPQSEFVAPPSSYLPSSYNQVGGPANNSATSLGKLSHGRKRSETAIIEDASAYYPTTPSERQPPSIRTGPPSPSAYRGQSPLPPPVIPVSHDDDSEDSSIKPRRKFWFGGSKAASSGDAPRRHPSDMGHDSDDGETRTGLWPFRRTRNKSDTDAQVAPPPPPDPTPGRSFQVVRAPRPTQQQQQQRPGGGDAGPSSWRRPSTAPDHGDDEEAPVSPPETPRASTWSRRQSSPYA